MSLPSAVVVLLLPYLLPYAVTVFAVVIVMVSIAPVFTAVSIPVIIPIYPSAQPDLLLPLSFRPVVVSFIPDHCRRSCCVLSLPVLLWYAYCVTSLLPVVIVVSVPVCCCGCPVVVSLLSFLYSLLSLPNEEVKKALAKSADLYLYCHKNLTISELLALTFYL